MGRNKDTRYKMSMGLAFNEEEEMEMLGRMAKEGWIFERFSLMGYFFRKGEPKDLIYCMDTRELKEDEREDYFGIFEEAGWNHVYSIGNSMHFFSAPEGTKPIYTDRTTIGEKLKRDRNDVFKGTGIFAALWLISTLLLKVFDGIWEGGIPSLITMIIAGGSLGVTIVLIIAGLLIGIKLKRNSAV